MLKGCEEGRWGRGEIRIFENLSDVTCINVLKSYIGYN